MHQISHLIVSYTVVDMLICRGGLIHSYEFISSLNHWYYQPHSIPPWRHVCSNTFKYSITNYDHVSQLHMHQCAWIKVDSVNGRYEKLEMCDVTNRLPFHKTAISTTTHSMCHDVTQPLECS